MVYKFKDIDISYLAPMAFHEKRARRYSSSSDDSHVSHRIIMPEMLIELPSSLSSSAEEINIENIMGVENSNQNEIETENLSDLENAEEFSIENVMGVENSNENDIQTENSNQNEIQTENLSDLQNASIENVTMGVENSNPKKNRRKNGNYDIQTENLVSDLENEEEFLATAVRPHTYENGILINDRANGVFYFTVVVSPAPQIMDFESECDAEGGPSAVLVSTMRTGPNNYKYEFKYE